MKMMHLQEEWDEREPLKNTPHPLDWWDQYYVKMLSRYTEVKASTRITHEEVEMLIGADKELFDVIDSYKATNTPITDQAAHKLVSIISRVVPFQKTFYRGTETETYDDNHIMNIQSWSANQRTAEMFGRYIYKTTGAVRGIELSNIYYWHGSLYGGHSGLGDAQAEWLLLPPKKVLI